MRNCPNCGAPFSPYECKCKYCGTWYFDFTAFDMSGDGPYYVRFKTPYGIVTTLAKPELQAIDCQDNVVYIDGGPEKGIIGFSRGRTCDLNVVFHSCADRDGNLYKLKIEEINDESN